jgi:hypothetical protein
LASSYTFLQIRICNSQQDAQYILDQKSSPDTPKVNCGRVPLLSQQKFRGPVPPSDNAVGVVSLCLATSSTGNRNWFIEYARKAKVCNAENAAVVDEKICGYSNASDQSKLIIMQ